MNFYRVFFFLFSESPESICHFHVLSRRDRCHSAADSVFLPKMVLSQKAGTLRDKSFRLVPTAFRPQAECLNAGVLILNPAYAFKGRARICRMGTVLYFLSINRRGFLSEAHASLTEDQAGKPWENPAEKTDKKPDPVLLVSCNFPFIPL
jgi:cytochrome c peroxidase